MMMARAGTLALLAGLLALPPAAMGADAGSTRWLGPGSCSASNCHGSVAARVDSPRSLQNEYVTWFKQDRHAKAYAALGTPLGFAMARRLGMVPAGADATTWIERTAHPERCLDCHATNAPAEARGPRFDLTDGVGCESCHGPAGGWLDRHTEKGWTPAQSVAAGMIETSDPAKTAETCLGCHLGSATKRVDHELIAAGHPSLAFELDTFAANLPAHWVRHDGNQAWFGGGPWALGQVVTLREAARHLERQLHADGWPDFAAYDCYACHHDLGARSRWRQDRGGALPGRPPWDRSRYAVLSHLARVVDADVGRRLDASVARLDDLGRKGRATPELGAACAATAAAADDLLARLRGPAPLDVGHTDRLLRALTGDANHLAFDGFRTAQQVAWSLDSLATARPVLLGGPAAVDHDPLRAAVGQLFDDLTDPAAYDPARFAHDVRALDGHLP
jgi:hypothetical protein